MNYSAFSVSVKGESHIRKNIVCQDYSGHINGDNVKIAVVSDGHGDTACFRSHKGSEFAVKACIEGLTEFSDKILKGDIDKESFSIEKRKNELVSQMIKGIAARWNMYVIKDINENPIEPELEKMKNNSADIDAKTLGEYEAGENLNHIYGATLIALMIVDNFVMAMHQGDGRCIFLNKSGDFYEPVPWDDRCYMNVTTSICDEDAVESFRFYTDIADYDNMPIAMFAASDGIEDSYSSKETMLCFYRLICIEITNNGLAKELDYMRDELLSDISREGSADDMSVAGIIDSDSLSPLTDRFQRDNNICAINQCISDTEERRQSMEGKMNYLNRLYDKVKAEIEELEKNIAPYQQDSNKDFMIKRAEMDKISNDRDNYLIKYNELNEKYNKYIEEKERLLST